MRHNPVYIGYWRRNEDGTQEYFGDDPTLPFPKADFLISEKAVEFSLKCLDELENHPNVTLISYMGWSNCRICGCRNGTKEFVFDTGDIQYHWPEGLRHYIEEHRVELPSALWDIHTNHVN